MFQELPAEGGDSEGDSLSGHFEGGQLTGGHFESLSTPGEDTEGKQDDVVTMDMETDTDTDTDDGFGKLDKDLS